MAHQDYTKYSDKTEVEDKEETVTELEVVEPAEVVEEAVEEPEVTPSKTGRVFACSRLNVRANPSKGAAVVCEIPCDTEVEIDESCSTDDFYKICTASGIEGYCVKSYILEN